MCNRYVGKSLMCIVSLSEVSRLRNFIRPVFREESSNIIVYGIPRISAFFNRRLRSPFEFACKGIWYDLRPARRRTWFTWRLKSWPAVFFTSKIYKISIILRGIKCFDIPSHNDADTIWYWYGANLRFNLSMYRLPLCPPASMSKAEW